MRPYVLIAKVKSNGSAAVDATPAKFSGNVTQPSLLPTNQQLIYKQSSRRVLPPA